ncbi:hypothetical protein B0I35DRAFT_403075 [Stachybotrys elegans]|uniref:Uncharacterized protein n=1 Tax=Stachybotrys elegans TaxID=80388 RepID=A0A8K0SEW8_9HYPO|nr:hypothetical protein B0I35DRAFT_403075 [Stachybotrys elegans]
MISLPPPPFPPFLGHDHPWILTDFTYHRAAVQHLGLFVPWERFTADSSGDLNDVWTRHKQRLSRRLLFVLDNIQLLRRSAEDAKRDAKQWAASSADDEHTVGGVSWGDADGDDGSDNDRGAPSLYRCDNIGEATRLIDVLRSASGSNQITAGSKELSAMTQQLCRFQHAALGSTAELRARIVPEQGTRMVMVAWPDGTLGEAEVPTQRLLKSIKSQQASTSREIVKMIQGIQGMNDVAVNDGPQRRRSHDETARRDSSEPGVGPTVAVCFGPSTSFMAAGRQLVERFTLNEKQSIAFLSICRHLDLVCHGENENTNSDERAPQLRQFVGGEGGTGKDLIGNRIPAEMADAEARLEVLSRETVRQAQEWLHVQ